MTAPLAEPARGIEYLVGVVQDLSLARDLETVMAIVRRAARALTGADGATFVLREGDLCHYADEDAIAPLWKGKRFPMDTCISGWVMLHREPAVIEDIYTDPRIPADAYRPTFVKSLAMVPIRTADPLGAIGNYWATRRRPLPEEVRLLQSLADATAIAVAHVQSYQEARRYQAELDRIQRQYSLGAMASVFAHELNQPLTAIVSYSEANLRLLRAGETDGQLAHNLEQTALQAQRAAHTIRHVRNFLRRGEIETTAEDVNRLIDEVVAQLAPEAEMARIRLEAGAGDIPKAKIGRAAVEKVLLNLLHNALEAIRDAGTDGGAVTVRTRSDGAGFVRITVADTGPGLDPGGAERLFQPFYTTKANGLGMGLAISRTIIEAHGGRLWAEPAQDGAVFHFTVPVAS